MFLCDVEGRSFRGFRKRVFNLRAVYSAQRRSAIGVRDVFVSVPCARAFYLMQ